MQDVLRVTEGKIEMDKKIEGLISVTELLRQLSNVKVGEKVFLNTETEITEELQQTLKRHLEKNS